MDAHTGASKMAHQTGSDTMDVHASFQLAGRLKACQEILAREQKLKSWKVWLWILGQSMTVFIVFLPGLIHISHLSMLATCVFPLNAYVNLLSNSAMFATRSKACPS